VVFNYGMNNMDVMNTYFQFVSCHHGIARSQILDGGNGLHGQPTVGGPLYSGLDRS
jgi:hypothetical protein